jgi:hypothetical protein
MPVGRLRRLTVYLIHAAITAFASTLAFTNLVYRLNHTRLSLLELVPIVTVWGAMYFCLEVPAGVVADLFDAVYR